MSKGFKSFGHGAETREIRGFPPQGMRNGMKGRGKTNPGRVFFVRIDGQSNSEGIGDVATLPDNLRRQFRNTYIWFNATENLSGGSYQKLQAGVNNERASRLMYYGLEISLADEFERNFPDDRLYISKFGVGNTAVFNVVGSPNWNASAASGDNLITDAVTKWHIPSLASLPISRVIDFGLIWVQGEEDALDDTYTAAFKTNTLATFADFRSRLGLPTMSIIVVPLNFASRTGVNGPRGQTIRIAQSNKSGEMADSVTYPYNRYFPYTDNYQPLLDSVHFPPLPFGIDMFKFLFNVNGGSGLDPDYQRLLDKATSNGYILPQSNVQSAWNEFVLKRKLDGSWDRIDILYCFAMNDPTLTNTATMNYKAPGAHQLTINNAMVYGAKGFKGDAVSANLGTDFIIQYTGVNYLQDNASRGLWITTVHTSTNVFLDGTGTANINTIRASSTTGQRINQGSGNLNTAVDLSGLGYTAIDRPDNANVNCFKGLTKFARTSASAALTNLNQVILRSGSTYGDSEIGMYFMGASLTDTQHNNIRNDFQAYLTAIGL